MAPMVRGTRMASRCSAVLLVPVLPAPTRTGSRPGGGPGPPAAPRPPPRSRPRPAPGCWPHHHQAVPPRGRGLRGGLHRERGHGVQGAPSAPRKGRRGGFPTPRGPGAALPGTFTTTSMRRGPSTTWVAGVAPSARSTWWATMEALSPCRCSASRSSVHPELPSPRRRRSPSHPPRRKVPPGAAPPGRLRRPASPDPLEDFHTHVGGDFPDSASSSRIWMGWVKAYSRPGMVERALSNGRDEGVLPPGGAPRSGRPGFT